MLGPIQKYQCRVVHVRDALDNQFATRESNVFVIGQDKPWVSLPKVVGTAAVTLLSNGELENVRTNPEISMSGNITYLEVSSLTVSVTMVVSTSSTFAMLLTTSSLPVSPTSSSWSRSSAMES
jgi:hypothetical protein